MIDNLSAQEAKVIELAADGNTDKGIANELGISPTTVITYWSRIRAKLGHHPRPELVAKYVELQSSSLVETLKREVERREDELSQMSAHLEAWQQLIELAPEAILLVDIEGSIVYGNNEAAEFLHCSVNDFPGTRVGHLMDADLHEAHRKYREEYMKSPGRKHLCGGEPISFRDMQGNPVSGYISINFARTATKDVVIVVIRPAKPVQE